MYKVLKEQRNGFNIIELTEGPYSGCQLVYGSLNFGNENEDGSVNMSFDYNITNDFTVSKEDFIDFQNYIGSVLLKILEDSIEDRKTVFYGGSDEGSIEITDSTE